MRTVSKIINLAKSYLGTEQGSYNHSEILNIYNNYTPLPRGYKVKNKDAWCATFISSLAIKLGYTDLIPPECSCYYMIEQFKKLNIYHNEKDFKPKIGDLIFYDWDNNSTPDHVGIIESINGGVLTVIEGNRNKKVDKRWIELESKYIFGYARPQYDKEIDISEWSKEYWIKAEQKHIIDGTNPKGIATREQVITILGRLGLLD